MSTIYSHEHLFNNNKYTKWYYSIIQKAISYNRRKTKNTDINHIYYERHHILPQSLFPQYKGYTSKYKWNIVLLTPKEHFICHWLLIYMVNTLKAKIKMTWALNKLLTDKRNSRNYSIKRDIIRCLFTKQRTQEHKNKISKSNKGKTNYKDNIGNIIHCKTNDPRVLSGELVGITKGKSFGPINKGMVIAINTLTGNNVRISKENFDGIRYVGIRKGISPSNKCIEALITYNKSDEGKLKTSKQFKGIPKSEKHKEKLRKPKKKHNKPLISY